MSQQAFVLRISPSGVDRVDVALGDNQIIIGWSEAKGLLDDNLTWEQFRKIIQDCYYSGEKDLRRAGSAGGNMWRFIREMKKEDLVVVPHGDEFYIAEVDGPATYDPSKVDDDTAYRRPVKWLNDKKPIKRQFAKAALISRMKTYLTSSYATDLLEEIKECLKIAKSGKSPTFQGDLQSRLVAETLHELRYGLMNPDNFEKLIESVLKGLGAKEANIVAKKLDKGADVLATFPVAGAFSLKIAVQAKHWRPDPPVDKEVVEQLIRGIEAESANLGMVITTGTIGQDAVDAAEKYQKAGGVNIELVDGEQFAKLIVEHGISTV
jgi:predicted Mrr-cat superfamily restriction endonuclease